MRFQINFTDKWPISKISEYLLYLFSFAIPVNQFVSTRLLLLLLAVSFFVKRSRRPYYIRNSWDLMFYFLVLIIGLIYSENFMSGLSVLETSFAFIAFPIALNNQENLTPLVISRCFKSFLIGIFLSCIICLSNATMKFFYTMDYSQLYFYNFSMVMGFQPTYFAYYLIFGITLSLFSLYYEEKGFSVWFNVLVILSLFLSLLLTGSKTTFVSLLLVFAFFILKSLVDELNRIKKLTAILIVGMLFCLFIVNYIAAIDSSALSDSWERITLWKSAFEAVPDIILGVGTGDYKTVLNDYFLAHHLTEYAKKSMNSHNQMIQLLFTNGLLGLLAFIILIANPLYKSMKSQNMLGLVSLFPFVIYGITEVFLGRYQGIVFWVWMHQLFMQLTEFERPKKFSSAYQSA